MLSRTIPPGLAGAAHVAGGVEQADQLAAEAVADRGHRLARKLLGHEPMRGSRVEQRPVAHARTKAAQGQRPRGADAAVVIGQDAHAVVRQELGEAPVEARGRRGRAVHDHGPDRRPLGPVQRASEREVILGHQCGGLAYEGFVGSDARSNLH